MAQRTNPIGYCVVGAGIWGSLHVSTLARDPHVNLVAICDLDGEKARAVAQQCGIPKVYTSHEEMLQDPEIEAVSVATPDFAHGAVSLAVVEAGRHLLVEKPMATTSEECLAVIDAAKRTGVTLMVDMHNRWNPPFVNTHESLRSGELGEVRHIYFRLSDSIYVPLSYISWGAKTTVLWFLGPHAVDTVRWLFDDEVREVYCVRREGTLQALGVDTPDFYTAILQFERGGVATIEHSWIESPHTGNIFDLKCTLQATKGTVFVDASHSRYFEKYTEQTPMGYPHHPFQDAVLMPVIHGRQVGFGAESIRYFADCLWEGRKPLVTGVDGLRATEILEAANKSADLGAPVQVERHTV